MSAAKQSKYFCWWHRVESQPALPCNCPVLIRFPSSSISSSPAKPCQHRRTRQPAAGCENSSPPAPAVHPRDAPDAGWQRHDVGAAVAAGRVRGAERECWDRRGGGGEAGVEHGAAGHRGQPRVVVRPPCRLGGLSVEQARGRQHHLLPVRERAGRLPLLRPAPRPLPLVRGQAGLAVRPHRRPGQPVGHRRDQPAASVGLIVCLQYRQLGVQSEHGDQHRPGGAGEAGLAALGCTMHCTGQARPPGPLPPVLPRAAHSGGGPGIAPLSPSSPHSYGRLWC